MRTIDYGKRAALKTNNLAQSFGFTLWEVLIVLFLMGILLTSFSPHYNSAPKHVRLQMNQANIQRIEGAAQLYRIDVGSYPLSVMNLVYSPQGVKGWRGPYLPEIPINPFDSERGYQIDSSGRVYRTSAN